MSFIVIRPKANGRRYKYLYTAYRNAAGKPRQKTKCLGPIDPPVPRKRKAKIDWGGTVKGVVSMGVTAALGKLGPAGGKTYPSARYDPTHRAKQEGNNQLRELYEKHQMDDKDPDKFQATFDRLPK